MNKSQRAQKILEIIDRQGHCSVEELAAQLGISVPTVYRDLSELVRRNLAVRTHGTVEAPPTRLQLPESVNSRHLLRLVRNRIGKEQIADKALHLVQDDDIIFADSSTTVYYFIKKLLEHHREFSNLTIVSNSGAIIRELTDPPPSITLIAIGGVYHPVLNSFLGRIAVNAVEQLHLGKAFISAAAVSTSEVDTFHETHAEFLGQVVKHADQSYLLADHLKFETKAVFPICRTAAFAGILSDAELPEDVISRYLAAGIHFLI